MSIDRAGSEGLAEGEVRKTKKSGHSAAVTVCARQQTGNI